VDIKVRVQSQALAGSSQAHFKMVDGDGRETSQTVTRWASSCRSLLTRTPGRLPWSIHQLSIWIIESRCDDHHSAD
jgi:hypothetical protein